MKGATPNERWTVEVRSALQYVALIAYAAGALLAAIAIPKYLRATGSQAVGCAVAILFVGAALAVLLRLNTRKPEPHERDVPKARYGPFIVSLLFFVGNAAYIGANVHARGGYRWPEDRDLIGLTLGPAFFWGLTIFDDARRAMTGRSPMADDAARSRARFAAIHALPRDEYRVAMGPMLRRGYGRLAPIVATVAFGFAIAPVTGVVTAIMLACVANVVTFLTLHTTIDL